MTTTAHAPTGTPAPAADPLEGLVAGPAFTETFVFDEPKRTTDEYHSTQPDLDRRLFSKDGRLWLRKHSGKTAAEELGNQPVGCRITVEYFGVASTE